MISIAEGVDELDLSAKVPRLLEENPQIIAYNK